MLGRRKSPRPHLYGVVVQHTVVGGFGGFSGGLVKENSRREEECLVGVLSALQTTELSQLEQTDKGQKPSSPSKKTLLEEGTRTRDWERGEGRKAV